MSRKVTLSASAQAVLDGSGNGTASAGPQNPGEIWYPAAVAVKASTNVKEAQARVYAGNAATDAYFADGTTWGSTGDSTSNVAGPLFPGQQIFAVWTGGDPGAVATVTITGTRQVP